MSGEKAALLCFWALDVTFEGACKFFALKKRNIFLPEDCDVWKRMFTIIGFVPEGPTR